MGWHFLKAKNIVYNGGIVSYKRIETAKGASMCGGKEFGMLLCEGVAIYINKGTIYSSKICC